MLLPLPDHRHQVFLDRYSLKDEGGEPIEHDVTQMWDRIALAASAMETNESKSQWTDKFRGILDDFKFVPGGRILSGLGTKKAVTLFNCYVIPSPEDSRHGILDNIKLMVDIMARGGGVGVNLSTLRPKGAYIKTLNGHSSGPVAWMELYSCATGDVIQQGGSRRGALMLMLDDSHPDILDFIYRKSRFITDEDGFKRPEYLEHANISVAISNVFMHCVEYDQPWELGWGGSVYKKLPAREIFNAICERAWRSADPGLVFMGRCREMSNSYYFEDIRCVNPCGEQPLGPYSVCNLGSMNLAAYATDDAHFRWGDFVSDVRVAVRFMDNVIDINHYFLPQNEQSQRRDIRRCGLGTMGLADCLIKLKLRYGSIEAQVFTSTIFETMRDEAYETSSQLARERGPFGKFDPDSFARGKYIKTLPSALQQQIHDKGIRNCFLLTQAPTGTTSLLAGVSSGIEPNFDFAMYRRDRTGTHTMLHPLFENWCMTRKDGENVPDYFIRSEKVSVEGHILMQASAQKYIDAGVSKTINLPNSATVEDVSTAYMEAWFSGLKGITVYRDGSRDAVLTHLDRCPTCQGILEKKEGCETCPSCGYSACGLR